MTDPSGVPAPGRLAGLKPSAQWAVLLPLTALLSWIFELTGIPAALLLGALIAGILVGTNGGMIQVPRLPYLGAQSIVGCMIAAAITADIVATFLEGWPLFVGVVVAILAASSLLGWVMSRLRILPGTTAIWGSSPGAATAMMLMSEAYGADMRLVAFMQYVRVVLVAITASVIARFWLGPTGAAAHAVVWFPPIDWIPFLETLALAGIGGLIGRRTGIPAGGFLLPLAVGSVLHATGLMRIELTPWLLAACYTVLGWNVGLGFTRPIITHALRALPQIMLSSLTLIAFCGGLGFLLTLTHGIDPLTAYLATSPGGMDSVAIIAASTKVDVPFVMALQTVRFVIVMLVGPWIAKVAARNATRLYR